MTSQKDLRKSVVTHDNYIPCRYIQLPTLLVALLQDYFSPEGKTQRWLPAVSHLVHRELGAQLTDDQLSSALEIERFETYPGDAYNRTIPKVLVKRGATSIAKQSAMGSRQGMMGAGGEPNVIPSQYSGPITSFCLSTQLGAAEFLAAEVEQLYTHFALFIAGKLHSIKTAPTVVDAAVRLKEFPEFITVPVVLDYVYEDNVQVLQVDSRFRAFNLSLTSE